MTPTLDVTAADMRRGDTYIDRSGTHWTVRDVEPPEPEGSVLIRLAAGRTDPGTDYVFLRDERVTVFRRP
jgi:hypothetical protein